MGNKRKYNSEEEIRRKIQKLEKKLQKTREHVQISDEEPNLDAIVEEDVGSAVISLQDENHPESLWPESPCPVSPARLDSPERAAPGLISPSKSIPGPSSPKETQEVVPSESVSPTEAVLDDDILQLLGDAPKAEATLGPAIHKDVANRWQEILAKGLQKDVKDQIMQQYSVPNNCDLLVAPTLNPEVKAAIRDVMVKRDSALMYQQKQLAVAISALGTAVDSILSNETSKQKILKPISDACRILCDIHFHETKTRRHFVITSINTELKDSLVNTVRNDQLFGDNITEKIKTAKSIQKSGEALKTVPKPTYKNPANKPSTSKTNNLNYKPQQRKADNKTTAAAARGRPAYRTTRPGPSDSYRPPHRSPPHQPPPPSSRRTHRT
ncbi:uncharacterized protein LOC114350832 isoform X1 [Ostrinia furnacalis]|uniref:uncharacterized protein LOC114350832 isoform X1 n=1 Tax=Ostrinia furnacalis TaxID=93504 RepID=UPI00103E886F|nr:uncharacterized protein LOC114350832 isoform X1 [Ostrinia furnacalis]